ncbi:MAG: homocysteine S-methyltransferase [Planctomycetota bacterium]|jgi:homocysteine S-methyltransferase
MPNLRERLEHGPPVILDGGLATELEQRGSDLRHELWSARLLDEDPDAIREVHRAYVEAGAECVITATYQAPAHPTERLALAVRLARASGAPFVAGSIGPYGASLADGSEYTGDYPDIDLRAWHAERFEFLAGCDVDVLACETIPNVREAEALASLVTPDMPAWFSFSCKDRLHLRDGTPLREAARIVEPVALAIGVNCTEPCHVANLIGELPESRPVVVYPNSGEIYANGVWSGDAEFERYVDLWLRRGVRMIGGCCRVGPAEIRELAARTTPDPLAERIRSERDCGQVRLRSAERGDLDADGFAKAFGLTALGVDWVTVNREEALRLLTNVLHRDLAYEQEIMPRRRAAQLARRFLDQADEDSIFLTNGTLGLGGGGWTPLTESTFDTGILALGSSWIRMLWVEDAD